MNYIEVVNDRLRQSIKKSEKSLLTICEECDGQISYPTLLQFCKSEYRKIDKLSHIWALCKVLELDIMTILKPESEELMKSEAEGEVSPCDGELSGSEQTSQFFERETEDGDQSEVITNPAKNFRAPYYKWNCADVLTYIDEHYMDKLSLESIANHFFINKYHLSKTFKKKYGITVFQYIRKVRLTQAQRLLNETEHSIGYIAKLCGYDDVSYFYRIFKESTGITAKESRNRKIESQL